LCGIIGQVFIGEERLLNPLMPK